MLNAKRKEYEQQEAKTLASNGLKKHPIQRKQETFSSSGFS